MPTQIAKPVTFWPMHRPAVHRRTPHFRSIAVTESCRRSPTGGPWRTTRVISDAEMESSVNTYCSEVHRKISSSSSESDGRPQIVVHTTSVEEDDDVEFMPNIPIPYLLSVSGVDSVTSTDIGSDYTSEGGDSSQEVDIKSVTPELKAALVKQLEEYLSDESLANDIFLLKHVKQHRDGYVSLKLLSGKYKKIKKLSRNWRVLSLALRGSTNLQVNEEGTKVRRRTPLPTALLYDAPASRTLVAVNIPTEHATIGGLATLFGTCGGVASLQVIRPKPGGEVPPELQHLLVRLPEVATVISAIIEYEDMWGAARALRELAKPPMTLHVLRRTRQNKRPMGHSCSRTSPAPTPKPKGRPQSRFENDVSLEELQSCLRGSRSGLKNLKRESSASDGDDSPNGRRSWRTDLMNLTPQPPTRPHYRRPMGSSMSTPSSPAVFRRTQQKQFGVLRAPRGPDGTKGFARGNL